MDFPGSPRIDAQSAILREGADCRSACCEIMHPGDTWEDCSPAIPYIPKDAGGGVFARSAVYRQVTVGMCRQ
jgi:hypothetical protein